MDDYLLSPQPSVFFHPDSSIDSHPRGAFLCHRNEVPCNIKRKPGFRFGLFSDIPVFFQQNIVYSTQIPLVKLSSPKNLPLKNLVI